MNTPTCLPRPAVTSAAARAAKSGNGKPSWRWSSVTTAATRAPRRQASRCRRRRPAGGEARRARRRLSSGRRKAPRSRVINSNGGGYYDDVYVKTPKGWRFKSRNVISDAEVAAHLTTEDFIEIRQLAGDDHGHYENLYGPYNGPIGPRNPSAGRDDRPFRTSGLKLTVAKDGVSGLAYLRENGGHYEDLYVKTPQGWRIKERNISRRRRANRVIDMSMTRLLTAGCSRWTVSAESGPRQDSQRIPSAITGELFAARCLWRELASAGGACPAKGRRRQSEARLLSELKATSR